MTHTRECVENDADQLQLPQLDLRTPIEPRPQGCVVPLTTLQRRMFFEELIRAGPEERPISQRMCASATRITGPLNVRLLQGSIAGLVRRHESFRTTFKLSGRATTQHIHPPGEYRLTCVDLSAMPKSEAESECERLSRQFQDQKIDLSTGHVFEARLFKLATQENVLIVLADHMISDGMSNTILDKEIWQAYDYAIGDEPALLPTPPVQFADYAVWEERTKDSWRTEHEDYWTQHLAGGTPTIIPISSETNKYLGTRAVAHISFGSALITKLRQFAERKQVSLSNVTLMVYATAMSLWCDKEDLIIRCPVHGHRRPELQNVIGLLVNFLYLRIKVDRASTLHGLLAQVQDEMRSAIAHQDFNRVRYLMPECANTQLEFHWRPARWRGRAAHRLHDSNQLIKRQPFWIRSQFDANFFCVFNETPSDICATVFYRASSLRPNAIGQFGDDMRSIAKALIDRPFETINGALFSHGTPDV